MREGTGRAVVGIAVLGLASVLSGCKSIPCPGMSPELFKECNCEPVERRMLVRAKALTPVLYKALSSCLEAEGSGEYAPGPTAAGSAKGSVKACIDRKADLDAEAKDKLLAVVDAASAQVDPREVSSWTACYDAWLHRHVGSGALPEGCRDKSHGVERYQRQFDDTRTSAWMKGGHTQKEWCDQVVALLEKQHPEGHVLVKASSESSRDDCPPLRCIVYQYVCTVTVQTDPIYIEKVSSACKQLRHSP